MVEDLVKDGTKFAVDVTKNAIVAVAIILAIIVVLFLLQTGTDAVIVIVKQIINLLQYAVNTLL